MRRHPAIPLIALLLASGLGACAGSDDHNDADVAFAQGMIPHHEQAVEMADLTTDAAGSAEVREIASQIKEAQQPEIDTMKGWLDDWGTAKHTDHLDHGQGGMVSDSSMKSLKTLSGSTFDRKWLDLMIEHHEGAITASVREVRDGRNGEAVHLANQIVDTQQAEIDIMKGIKP
jgi:uncharacterized protein (DUF305 family)